MAKASKNKPVEKDELKSLVQRQLRAASVYYDSKLSSERQSVLEYYQGEKPAPLHKGNSKYVSMDVFDSVESLKAVLLETFSAGNRIVSFDPQTDADVEPMKIATAYADYVVHRQNDSYNIFSQLIHDGLVARCGIVKVYWEERIEEHTEEFEGISIDDAEALMAQDDVSDMEMEADEETGLYSGSLTRTVDKSQVVIDNIPPEEFLITSTASSIKDAGIVSHRTRKTKSELKEMGYDPKLIAEIGSGGSADELQFSQDKQTRFEDIGATFMDEDASEVQEASEGCLVYESYLYIDMDGSGITKLWKITMADDVILDKEEAECKPFLHFCPLPTPHAFYGSNYAARVIPTQNARTTLVRGILDHTVITNNPRMMVVKGAVTNPKELLENRVGGLVNVTRPDGLLPLPQSGLNPFVFQTIGLLDSDKEQTTGVSKLSQGLNKDAVSKQNSQGMVENLVSLSQQREKIMARNFANQFIKPLFLEVYRLVLLNEKKQKVMRVAGAFVQVDPQEWAEEVTCTVELKLGYTEQEQEAQKLAQAVATLNQDPAIAQLITPDNKYYIATQFLEKSGFKNVGQMITEPSKIQPPPPDPIKMKELEIEERKVAVQEAIAGTSKTKVEGHIGIEQVRTDLDKLKLQLENMRKERELDIKEFDSTSKAAIAVQEMEQAKEMIATDPASGKAIVSPN
jgi:hypothetical protein